MKKVLAFSSFLVLLSACDALQPVGNPAEADAPEASYLLVPGGNCPELADPATAFSVFAERLEEGGSDVIGVAKVRVIEECSGAGGTHALSSATIDGDRFWLGRHGCYLDEASSDFRDGIIVGIGSQTAAWFESEAGWCIQYPGEDNDFGTDISTYAMAWFATEEDAKAFVNSLER